MNQLRCYLFLLLCLPLVAACEVHHQRNPETGMSSWKVEKQGLSLELVQITPDYVKAVFSSRGLPPEVVNKVGGYCVFGTIIRNLSNAAISNRIANWRYITADGVKHVPKTKSEWLSEWRERGITFRWVMMSEDQTYQVGDWGQGFTTVKLPPGTPFDLVYAWHQDGKIYSGEMKGLSCAPRELADD